MSLADSWYEPAAALHRTHHRRVVFFPRIHLVDCITSKFHDEGVVPVTVRSRDHMGSSFSIVVGLTSLCRCGWRVGRMRQHGCQSVCEQWKRVTCLMSSWRIVAGRQQSQVFVRTAVLYFILPDPGSQPCGIMQSAQDQCGDLLEVLDGVGWKNKLRFKMDTHSIGCVLSSIFLNRSP